MRITKLEITNFQGLRHAALDVSAPVLLVAGHNGAGKSSLLDAISHAFTGKPGRVAQKQHIGQLITEGAKKGEARVEWLDDAGEVQACGVALPSGKGSPLADSPFLPFVLDASRFAALDAKDRRRVLFDLTGASASPAEVGKRLKAKGIDLALFEKVKPLLRSGFSAMVGQAKDYASEARGAWKAVTGENYGSEKANGWEPEAPPVIVSEEELESARAELRATAQDLDEAQQTLGSSKRAHADAQARASRITALRETAALADRRRNKLATDEANQDEWSEKVMAAEAAASGEPAHQPLTCPHCQGAVDLQAGQLVAHQPPAKVADPEAAKRLEEYRGYLASAQRAVANSRRDLKESEDAAALAAAHLVKFRFDATGAPVDQPMPTITSGGECKRPAGAAHALGLASAVLVGVGGRAGQTEPRSVAEPMYTITAKADCGVATAFMVQANGGYNTTHSRPADAPISTITNKGSQQQLATAHLVTLRKGSHGAPVDGPLGTQTGTDHHGLVAAHLLHLRGNCDARAADEPLHTVSAGGTHHGLVTAEMVASSLTPEQLDGALWVSAFLMRYHSTGGQWAKLDDPLTTITTKDRLALVTVWISGSPYVIVDIRLRMLKPRELYRAQGFPDSYIIERGHNGQRFTLSQQVHMCGNSVSPNTMAAYARANDPWKRRLRPTPQQAVAA
ncbi:AAA family ATPase [Pseudomonas aeruginosa]|uniref:AAA family ATPase n=6 Tax=Pseudomonas aeruginosa TaxID=287 RepID=UPI002A6AF4E0|nr:AAA family ATPase [Pseudomonas aeruginosa]MDY1388334.1 AAA family ATPase [Pseudomonas aeruginosa]MDY1399073.1 AAA family ATPase [Pseudomonas aeruginosa]